MSYRASQVDRFVKALHRRMVLLRAAERIGACLVGACAVSLILVPLLAWRERPVGFLALTIFGLALLSGAIWGMIRRPTALGAAIEADRQLGWADLLASAWLVDQKAAVGGAEESFAEPVLAMAEARCLAVVPSAVVLHRFGRRAWGLIGLGMVLVFAMVLLLDQQPGGQARAASSDQLQSWAQAEDQQDAARRTNVTRLPTDPDYRRAESGRGGDDDPANAPVSPRNESGTASAKPQPDAPSGTNASDNGTGAGAAQSGSTAKPSQTGPAIASSGDAEHRGAEGATRSSSGGGTGEARTGVDGASGMSAGTDRASTERPAPPWRSQSWPADRLAAQQAMESGRIPDAYRALVRDYFAER